MTQVMRINARLFRDMCFALETERGHTLPLDMTEESGGTDEGPCPMEALLMALAGCAGMGVITILRKMRQDVTDYTIHVRGERSELPPHIFTSIILVHSFFGHNIQSSAVQRAIELNEERYCSVGAMLNKATMISHSFQIVEM